jgi:uncharacterized protein with HEPN domain
VRDDRECLRDILDAIHQVERYLGRGRGKFDADELVQVWLLHHPQIIGEAARGLSRGLRAAHPEVPWADIMAFRNLLVHEYFGIDLQEVWDTALNDLPPLKRQVENILQMQGGSDAAAVPQRSHILVEPVGRGSGEGAGRARPGQTGEHVQMRPQTSTPDRMRKALEVVVQASQRFRQDGLFEQGVLNRLNSWKACLPCDDCAFVREVVEKAAARETGTGADYNGVALDERGMASLESLVLHYSQHAAELFRGLEPLIEQIRAKPAPHGGPKYRGPWP